MHATTRGRHFEEFTVGERYVTLSRTITEADVVSFAALTGDYNPLHVDAEFGKKTQFGERIAHGMLGASYAVGQIAALGLTEGTVIAIVHMTWDFTAPIKIGDTIHVEQTVKSVRETQKRDRGIVVFDVELINQRGEVVQKGERTLLVARKPVQT
ncbi:MAG: MaoC/PaaZ C-terminal domain-containing protein [Candidatus Methylomirabilaceae bacterium]